MSSPLVVTTEGVAVVKFNPYHERTTGQFSSGGSGGAKGRPAGTKPFNAADVISQQGSWVWDAKGNMIRAHQETAFQAEHSKQIQETWGVPGSRGDILRNFIDSGGVRAGYSGSGRSNVGEGFVQISGDHLFSHEARLVGFMDLMKPGQTFRVTSEVYRRGPGGKPFNVSRKETSLKIGDEDPVKWLRREFGSQVSEANEVYAGFSGKLKSTSDIAVTSEGLAVFKSSMSADQETELIKTSAQTQQAQLSHPFKAAQWTHPNGHPRCRVCGCEETVDGTCPGLKAEPVRFGPGAAGSVKVATSEGIVVAKFNPHHDKGTGQFASGGVAASSPIEAGERVRSVLEDNGLKTVWNGRIGIYGTTRINGEYNIATGQINLSTSRYKSLEQLNRIKSEKRWDQLSPRTQQKLLDTVRTLNHEMLHGVGGVTADFYRQNIELVEGVVSFGSGAFLHSTFHAITGFNLKSPERETLGSWSAGWQKNRSDWRVVRVTKTRVLDLLRSPSETWHSKLAGWAE